MKLALITLLVVGMSVGLWITPQGSSAASVRADTIACTWAVIQHLQDLTGDKQAFERRWKLGVLTGDCITLNAGETVIVIERSVWHNATRVKKPGSLRTDLWMPGSVAD